DFDVGHVLYADRHAVVRLDDDGTDLLDVDGPPQAVDEEHHAVLANVAAAHVAIVLVDGLADLVEGEAVLDQPGRVNADLVLSLEAAPRIDLGDSANRA